MASVSQGCGEQTMSHYRRNVSPKCSAQQKQCSVNERQSSTKVGKSPDSGLLILSRYFSYKMGMMTVPTS